MEPDQNLGKKTELFKTDLSTKVKETNVKDQIDSRVVMNKFENPNATEKWEKFGPFYKLSTRSKQEGGNGPKIADKSCHKIASRSPSSIDRSPKVTINHKSGIIGKESSRKSDVLDDSDKNIAVLKPKLPLVNSPIRGKIQIGKVAAIKGKFDRLVERERIESENQVKRLSR